MQIVITAVGPDNRGLADPIVHSVTSLGANIAEIQMYDHDAESVFSMLTRVEIDPGKLDVVREAMDRVGHDTGLSVRTWTPDITGRKPRLAICVTYRPETPLAVLRAIRDGHIKAEPAVMISNRSKLRGVAEQFDVPWRQIGDASGDPDDGKLLEICDELGVDYIVLARYMRVLPAASCWSYAGGRIINLHHGLLPSFPGIRPYHDAHQNRMLTYGATCHFIVPELDAGNQIINQQAFTVAPGVPLDEIVRRGQEDNEPSCLVEGVRRVVEREVSLHFNRVVAGGG
ncbi:Formyltetrahydrofolate deformylase [Pseudobythopirellula maris]|uniref:Formyltetrahydrofolate deformylase n=1 Tax=Pseudobythopirellula maris TaxID=2527991 RepID=A0A5C5ZT87_9BACT|nr:formyltransferase family protein [Pseudobythopirellula maris]TWT90436.1 Formyltetrahydrofolate deformylase [Pseudobythopirellula maris]